MDAVSGDGRGGQPPEGESGSQDRYYQRYQEASGEALTGPPSSHREGAGGRRGLLLAVVAIVVAIVIVAGVIGINVFGGGNDQQAGPLTPSRAAATTSSASQSAQTWVNPSVSEDPTTVRPLQPGWQSVLARPKLASAAYDVPKKDWTSRKDGHGLDLGWEDSNGKNIISLGSASAYKLGFCDTNENVGKAGVGFYGIGTMDPADETPRAAKKFADAIALEKDNKSHARESSVTTRQTSVQGLPAIESTIVATVGDPKKSDCSPRKVEVRAVGVSMGSKSTLLVLTRSLGVPGGLTGKEAEAILQTLRPAQG